MAGLGFVSFGLDDGLNFGHDYRKIYTNILKKHFTFSSGGGITKSTRGEKEHAMLYHGSHNQNLIEEISTEGIGVGTGCSGFFCCDTARRANEYGQYVYRMNDLPMFDNSDADADVLAQIVTECGINYEEHGELCWSAIAAEDLSYDEQEEWAELVEKDIDDAMWFAQSLRIDLARRQGFQSVGMNDECGSIVVLREFAKFERVEICPECGEDKNSEDCDCEE